MRRKNKFAGRVPAELLDYRLWCDARGLVGYEEHAFSGWCAERAAWAGVHGWPSGDIARQSEEITASVHIPDEPWDESAI